MRTLCLTANSSVHPARLFRFYPFAAIIKHSIRHDRSASTSQRNPRFSEDQRTTTYGRAALFTICFGSGVSLIYYLRLQIYLHDAASIRGSAEELEDIHTWILAHQTGSLVMSLNKNANLVTATPPYVLPSGQSSFYKTSAASPPEQHFIENCLMGPRGFWLWAYFHRHQPLLWQPVYWGYCGSEGVFAPAHVSHGLATTAMQEAARNLAQYWFPAEVSYRLTHSWTSFDETSFTKGPTCCVIAIPARDLVKQKAMIPDINSTPSWMTSRNQDSHPDWLNLENEGENKNVIAVFLLQRRPRYFGVMEETRLVGRGFIRFDVSDAEWKISPRSGEHMLDNDVYATALAQSGVLG